MEQSEIFEILRRVGIPVTYREWPVGHAPKLPYIIFSENDCERFVADNTVYVAAPGYDVELCTEGKNNTLENKLTDIFAQAEIIWDYTGEARTPEGIYIVSMNV